MDPHSRNLNGSDSESDDYLSPLNVIKQHKSSTKQTGNQIFSDADRTLAAAESGELALLKDLITKEPNLVHSKDIDGYTALHRASYNNHVECARYLLDSGADIHAKTNDGWEPIHSASKWCNVDIIELLLQRGADINSQSSGGNTPLHLAASNGRKTVTRDAIQLLLFHPNCQHELTNHSGDTAFDLARRSGPFYRFWSGVRTVFDCEYPQ